jgi:hypothetical protein
MEPITTVVTALAAGACAALKDTTAQAVKDAYVGLKDLIVRKYPRAADGVRQLEAAPDSKARRAVVEEDLGTGSTATDPEVLRQAQEVFRVVLSHNPEGLRVIGIDLEEVKGASLKLADVLASGSGPVTGVKVKGANIAGEIEIQGVRASEPSPPKAQGQP